MSVKKTRISLIILFQLVVIASLIPFTLKTKTSQEYNNINVVQGPIITDISLPTAQSEYIFPYNGSELSNYTFTLYLDEPSYAVNGIMEIDYFNNDSLSFDDLPFRLMVPNMSYDTRPGQIQIHSVLKDGNPSTPLSYQTYPDNGYMRVNLSETLQPKSRTQVQINFTTTFPDGGKDRCNEHELDDDPESQIFKWAWAYPMPAVYDEYDGWNLDPYAIEGDSFYSDMAWYKMSVEVPDDMVVAGNGNLTSTESLISTTRYHYDPVLPIREVTFSASRYFEEWRYAKGDTEIGMYFLNSSTHWDEIWNNTLNATFDWYESLYGEYVYPSLNIVEEHTHYGGMEHSCQVYITSTSRRYTPPYDVQNTEIIIAHELGHQCLDFP